MVECHFCGSRILRPRRYNGVIVQRFCSAQCRWRFHNRKKGVLARQLMDWLGKTGLLDLSSVTGGQKTR